MLTSEERRQLELAETILSSEPMMRLMVGTTKPESHRLALFPFYRQWCKLSGGHPSYNKLNGRLRELEAQDDTP